MKCFVRLSSLTVVFLFLMNGGLPGVFHDALSTAEAANCAFAGTVDEANPCDAGLDTEVKMNLGDNVVTSCKPVQYKNGATVANITGTIEEGFCPAPPPVPALVFPTVPVFPSVGDAGDENKNENGNDNKDKDKNKNKNDSKNDNKNENQSGSSNNQSSDFDSPSTGSTEFHEGDDCPPGWPNFNLATHTDANGFLVGASPFQFCKIKLKSSQTVKVADGSTVWVAGEIELQDTSVLEINGKVTIQTGGKVEIEDSANLKVNNAWLTLWINKEFEMKDNALLEITGDASIHVKQEVEIKDNARIDLLDGTLTLQTDDKFEMRNNAALNQNLGRPSQALVLVGTNAELKDSAVFVGALIANGKIEMKNTASVLGSVLSDSLVMRDAATIGFRTGAGSDTKGFGCVVFTDANPGDANPADIDPEGFTFGPIGTAGCTVSIPCVGTNIDRLKVIYHREFLGTFSACNPFLPAGDPLACDGVRNNPENNGLIVIPPMDLQQGVTGTNIKIAPLGAGMTACTVGINEPPWDNTDCGYRIAVARAGTMLKIDTKPRNGALNCLMKFVVQVPSTFHIEEEADPTELEEPVINEHSVVDDPRSGLVGNRGHAVILGMTGRVKTLTTSGSVFADLTSDNVRMKSLTGDSWAQGLTQKGYFRSWGGGSLRINYCRVPLDTPGKDLTIFTRKGVLSPIAGDIALRFPSTTANQVFESLIAVTNPVNQFKNSLGNCPMCLFKVQGRAEGGLLISGKTAQACKF